MLRCCRWDVEVPAQMAAAVCDSPSFTSGKYVFVACTFFLNFTSKRVPELVISISKFTLLGCCYLFVLNRCLCVFFPSATSFPLYPLI